jgi:LPXTG-motif cell wall-anchored protein
VRRIIVILTAASVVAAMMVITVPAMAQTGPTSVAILVQQDKEKDKTDQKSKTEQDKGKTDEKDKNLPKSGGIPVANVALLGMGAAVLLVGGGLLVRKIVR